MNRRLRTSLALLFLLLVTGVSYAGTSSLIDPVSNPAGFLDQLLAFAHTSWPVALALGAYAAMELLATVGKAFPAVAALAWFGTGRVSLALAGGIAVLGAGLNAYLAGGALQPALIAALVALAAFWHPKAQAVETKRLAGFARLHLMALLALAAMVILACSCGASQRAAEKQFGACTETAAVKQLEPVVQAIAESDVGNFKGVMLALAAAFGADEIDCVAPFVKQLLQQKVGGASEAVKRLDEWLSRSKSARAELQQRRLTAIAAMNYASTYEEPAFACARGHVPTFIEADGWTCEAR